MNGPVRPRVGAGSTWPGWMVLAWVVCATGAMAHEPELIPMPADIPPHPARAIIGPHHVDISGFPEELHHSGTHFVSYGLHNYDMSSDPSLVERFPHETRRYRGMGLGQDERMSMLRRSLDDIPAVPREKWVDRNAFRRGLAYRMPEPEASEEEAREARGFPRPSWYVVYKGQKRHRPIR